MCYCEKNDIREIAADWLYASGDVPAQVCKIAAELAVAIISDIEDYREDIDYDCGKDNPECTPRNIAFDLMTIICFEGESTEAVRHLPRSVAPEDRNSVCREYGISDSVLDCVLEWNRRYTPHMSVCAGIEECLSDSWGVPCDELRDWKRQLMGAGQ